MEGSEWGFAEHAGTPLPEVPGPQRMWFQPQSFKLCKKLGKTNPSPTHIEYLYHGCKRDRGQNKSSEGKGNLITKYKD